MCTRTRISHSFANFWIQYISRIPVIFSRTRILGVLGTGTGTGTSIRRFPRRATKSTRRKLRRFRRCFCGIPEFDLDRIEGSDESRSGDFGHSTDSTVPEFLDLDRVVDSDESRFGDFGHSPDPTDPGGFAENRPSGFRFDKFRTLLGAPSLPDCSPCDPLLASAAVGCAISGRLLA